MISKVQAYNTNQPNFTSKVRVSDRFANFYTKNAYNRIKNQIKILENNGNKDLVLLDRNESGDSIYLKVYKKYKNKIVENNTWGYAPYTLENKKEHSIVDLYNKVANERKDEFRESGLSKIMFEYL